MKEKKKKNKKWVLRRHAIITSLARSFFAFVVKAKTHVKVQKFDNRKGGPYLILYNHQTAYDQFFVGMATKGAVYYVATEDIFSMGFVSKLLKYAVNPIPIKKQTADVKAIMTCLRVAKEGGTICLAPEGNRTYSGRTEYINPSIVPLAKKLGMPIALFRIEDGYGVQPRWSDKFRKGKMRAYVSRVIQPNEYSQMSNDELYKAICDELYVDEAKVTGTFKHRNKAQYLERALYVCPNCGLSDLYSHKDEITCPKCRTTAIYTDTKQLVGKDCDFPFEFVRDWYDYQADYINSFNPLAHTAIPLYTEDVDLSEVIPYKKKKSICKKCLIELYGHAVTVNTTKECLEFPFAQTSAITVLGRNKLNIYFDGKIYQIKGDKRFNALKYVHLYHRHKNITKGDENGKFLGL